MSLDNLIRFDEFITKDAISTIWIIGAGLITGSSLVLILLPLLSEKGFTWVVFVGVILLILGNGLWRILCEVAAVAFRINDSLISIDRKQKEQ